MKKVFIVHGSNSSPNSGWRPWLMGELKKMDDIYACALPMPSPEKPICSEWVEEIARQIRRSEGDEVCLVGHSLGVPAILRYLEQAPEETHIVGAALVSGPAKDVGEEEIMDFLNKPFDFENIKKKAARFTVIHGDKDDVVPFDHAKFLSKKLDADLIVVPGAEHLTGSEGWYRLPQLLGALEKMFA